MTQTGRLLSPEGIPPIDRSEFEDISRAMIANTAESAPPPAGQNVRGSKAHDSVSSGEIAIGVIIGRTSEFFDFFVYAIASVVVFPKLVFPDINPLTSTLYSFAIFALAFVARPAGTAIFM